MEAPVGVVVQDRRDEVANSNEDDFVLVEKNEDKDEEKELAVDLELIRDCFKPGAKGEVLLSSYIKGYQEMNKFVKLLGPLFTFVAYDVKRKIKILQQEMTGENAEYYVDLRTMIDFEKERDILYRSSPLSGTNALLMLNRALEFVSGFMEELMKDDEGKSLGWAASELYVATVGRFHPSILAKTFSGVLLLLPDRATIRSKVTKGKEEAEDTMRRVMPATILSVKETYEAAHTLYCHHDLQDME